MRTAVLALGLSACGYAPCGEVHYWTSQVDPRFDDDGDQYLDLIQGCGPNAGTTGERFDDVGYALMSLDADSWDMGDAVDLAYDYLPVTSVVFLASHLEVGEVLETDRVDGFGWHKPDGFPDAETLSWPLHTARLEILDGPRPTEYGGETWKISWDVVIGAPTDVAPQGFQTMRGTDWVAFEIPLWEWDPGGHLNIRPPDDGG